jgi:ribonucleoside-diphosphate reductase alpha chain
VSDDIYEILSQERKHSQTIGDTPPWYTTGGYQMFKQKYLYEANSVKEQFKRIAKTAAKHLPSNFRERGERQFFNMLWDGVLSPSTPVLANMGTNRGFPISCSGNYTGDSIDQFYKSKHEVAMLTKQGFGTSTYLGDVRPRGTPFKGGGTASGTVPLLASFVNDMQLVSQGSNRRGAFAGYLPIDHSDFDELCDYIVASPDDLNVGWNISDAFLQRLELGEEDAVRRYQKALKAKAVTGRGYFWFIDKANRKLPDRYKAKGLQVKASNLCSEILLPSNEDYTYSCVLSSINLTHWDEIKMRLGTDDCYIRWGIFFLDCVVSEFLDQSKGTPGFDKIRRFTEEFRALGLGVCGYHTMLMQKRIPWESLEANWLNTEIFHKIRKAADDASRDLAFMFDSDVVPRNSSLLAIAPTKSTALLMGGVSEGINPVPAFTFTQTTAAGNVDRIDPVLLGLMKERGVDIELAIKEVAKDFGSVQNVDWLNDEEKKVFKTAFEIDQSAVIRHAALRSPYLDQWQSVNVFFSADEKEEVISAVHKQAFLDERIVGLYYMYSMAGVKASSGECEVCQ